jgi:hypothetical protein
MSKEKSDKQPLQDGEVEDVSGGLAFPPGMLGADDPLQANSAGGEKTCPVCGKTYTGTYAMNAGCPHCKNPGEARPNC